MHKEVSSNFEQEVPLNKRRESFFKNLHRKLMSMAMAGFLILGPGASKEAEADQLQLKKGKAGVEFVLEPEITHEKLNSFKEKLEREEPEFMAWLEKYTQSVETGIDRMVDNIFYFDRAKDDNEEKMLHAFEEGAAYEEGIFSAQTIINNDHRILDGVRRNTLLREYAEFIKRNLKTIILGMALMDDSRAVRDNMVERAVPPQIDFHYHNYYFYAEWGQNFPGLTSAAGIGGGSPTVRPYIKFNPALFGFPGQEVNMSQYVNYFVHELAHALRFGSIDGTSPLAGNELGSVLKRQFLEGMAQNATYEIMQHLAVKKRGLSLSIGESDYDHRVVLVGLIRAILEAGGYSEALPKWDSFLIPENNFLQILKEALDNLGLDAKIADEIKNLKLSAGTAYPARNAIIGILARLNIQGIKISPRLVKDTLVHGREFLLEDWQIKNIENIMRMSYLSEDIAAKQKTIK